MTRRQIRNRNRAYNSQPAELLRSRHETARKDNSRLSDLLSEILALRESSIPGSDIVLSCEEATEAMRGFVAGTLEAPEALAFENHLMRGCPRCSERFEALTNAGLEAVPTGSQSLTNLAFAVDENLGGKLTKLAEEEWHAIIGEIVIKAVRTHCGPLDYESIERVVADNVYSWMLELLEVAA